MSAQPSNEATPAPSGAALARRRLSLGLALSAAIHAGERLAAQRAALEADASLLRATRPTAVNLAWALDRQLAVARE